LPAVPPDGMSGRAALPSVIVTALSVDVRVSETPFASSMPWLVNSNDIPIVSPGSALPFPFPPEESSIVALSRTSHGACGSPGSTVVNRIALPSTSGAA